MLLLVRLVGDSRVVPEAAAHLNLIGLESRLHAEGAAGPALAGKAVANGHGKRIAGDLEVELATVAGGIPGRHRGES